ncbi:MAG: hypothetical protein O2782_15715 [bacterium]|nr:hypothetical protein [bacterium]
MNKILLCSGILALALALASSAQGTEEASWGELKQLRLPLMPAGKRPAATSTTVVASSTETTEPAPAPDTFVDLAADETRTVTQIAWPSGKSRLYLSDLNSSATLDDDLYVSFTVPNGAVAEPTQIVMTVIGNRLSDLVIAFQPGGLVFETPASLWVKLGSDLVDVDTGTLTVWHEYADGTVEDTTVLASHQYKSGYYEFTAEIPGFSRYGLRTSK